MTETTSRHGSGDASAIPSARENQAEPDFVYRLILFRGQTTDSNPSERPPIRGRDRHPALQSKEIRVAELDRRAAHTFQTFAKRLGVAASPRRGIGLLACDRQRQGRTF